MEQTDILDSAKSWRRLALTLLIATIGNVGMWAIVVVLPYIEAEFGGTRAQASVPYISIMLGFALGNFGMGRMVDRYGITITLILAMISVGIGFVASGFSASIWMFTALQFLVGFGSGVCFGPIVADVSLWFLKRRGIAVAIAASGNYLSGAIWPVLLAAPLQDEGWRFVYFLMAGLVLLTVIPLSFLLMERVPEISRQRADAISHARAHSAGFSPRTLMWLLGFAGIACCVAMSMPQVHIVALCVDLGFGPAIGGQMLSLMLFGGVISRILSGIIADWLGGVRTVLIGSVLQGLALCLYLPADGLVSLYVVSLIFGLAQGGIVPSYAVVVREYMPSHEAGRRVGFVLMLTIVGMALGGWMSGWIYDLTGDYTLAFVNGIGWNFLNVSIMVMLLLRTRPGTPKAIPA
ncbi:MAG: MFS transporter [Pseudomonadota bacterium]